MESFDDFAKEVAQNQGVLQCSQSSATAASFSPLMLAEHDSKDNGYFIQLPYGFKGVLTLQTVGANGIDAIDIDCDNDELVDGSHQLEIDFMGKEKDHNDDVCDAPESTKEEIAPSEPEEATTVVMHENEENDLSIEEHNENIAKIERLESDNCDADDAIKEEIDFDDQLSIDNDDAMDDEFVIEDDSSGDNDDDGNENDDDDSASITEIDCDNEKFAGFPKHIIKNSKLFIRGKPLLELITNFYRLECDLCPAFRYIIRILSSTFLFLLYFFVYSFCSNRTKFDRLQTLCQHYVDEHSIKGYVICCGIKLVKFRAMAMHMARHLQPEAFTCPKCDKMLTCPKILQYHMQNHLPESERPLACPDCPRKFSYSSALVAHSISHQPESERAAHVCDECGKVYVHIYHDSDIHIH